MDATPTYSPELYERTHGPYGPGDFYVEEHECIQCGVPAAMAPDLIRARPEPDGSCYFYKQPETPGEVEQAILAMKQSCVCAVCYRGSDPETLVQISDWRKDHSANVPLPVLSSFVLRMWRRLRSRRV
ncbi:4Fe-4S single cluster domain of Ferredoxin I [Granulicella rosea]|uniref:4Fe-4S single cluster domain of Ferredoxin I n=1 Tax=Granulicella rosea TaxID=474952 RepID=A0A239IDT3_9BACT|nr:4Fe-4S single cluster domain of Ferredoxin I [Granulicella rosea]